MQKAMTITSFLSPQTLHHLFAEHRQTHDFCHLRQTKILQNQIGVHYLLVLNYFSETFCYFALKARGNILFRQLRNCTIIQWYKFLVKTFQ